MIAKAKAVAASAVETAERRVGELLERIAKFEKASGLDIDYWDAGVIGDAVAVLRSQQQRGDALDDLQRRLTLAESEVEHCRSQVAIFTATAAAPTS